MDHWCLMPWRNAPAMTWQAVEDCLSQTVPTRVLLIGQAPTQADREDLDNRIDARGDHRVLAWHFLPMLPSLSAVWNRALQFVWELGGTEALVVNNDVRLHPRTYELLMGAMNVGDGTVPTPRRNLSVSAVGVKEGQFNAAEEHPLYAYDYAKRQVVEKGGPDFSCFLLSREGHDKYPFDESFIPAYHEDLDMHRRYMLGGDGDRIFSVNLPFLHYASGTLHAYSPEERAKFGRDFAACKAYYVRKWNGLPNEETFYTPFGKDEEAFKYHMNTVADPLPVTTPDLQRYWQIHRRPTDATPD